MATEVKPRDGTVDVNGLRLHYLDWGNETAQPLLLLHGFTGHAHVWDSFAAALAHDFHIVALDQRGHGDSDWAPEYRPEQSVDDVHGVVEALGLHRMVLLGHSMGGGNAIHYTAAHPAEVERLVIVDIGPETIAAGSARITAGAQEQDVFESEEAAFQQRRAGNTRADEAQLRARTHYNLKALADGTLTWKWDKALRDPGHPRPRRTPDAGWTAVRAIPCPTLLVRGGESDILAAETAERMVHEMPNCTLVTIAGAGHTIPLDRPVEFEAAVRAWLGPR